LIEALANVLQQKYKVPVTPQSWPADALPDFLKPRVEVTGAENKTLAASRDLQALQTKLRDAEKKVETDVWEQAATKFERYHLSSWDFGDQPGQIELPSSSGVPLLFYPGLQVEDSEVSLRLFRNRQEAILASQQGISSLAEIALERELAWLQKDLRALNSVKDLYITLGTPDELLGSAYANVRNFLFDHAPIYPLRRTEFEAVVATAKDRLQGYLPRLIELVKQVLSSRQQLVLAKKQYPGIAADLNALVPAGFLQSTPWPRLQNFPRYLRSMQIRAERAVVNHVKDHEKSRQVVPYTQLLGKLRARKDLTPEQSAALDDFRWLIEELKVSIFSQELGTAIPISPARLNKILECGPLAPLLKSPA
jgi:ATP-dependent helicase HrpA